CHNISIYSTNHFICKRKHQKNKQLNRKIPHVLDNLANMVNGDQRAGARYLVGNLPEKDGKKPAVC
ncbi:hypothetical protein I2491_06195, partial [Levilactobacillus brevis]|nr:hypothetical protein [Levilactobacillus brevis]